MAGRRAVSSWGAALSKGKALRASAERLNALVAEVSDGINISGVTSTAPDAVR